MRGRPRRWTEERIEAELLHVIDELGHWPSGRELRRLERGGLAKAIIRYGGMAYWARRVGCEPHRDFGTQRWTEERIGRELAPFLAGRSDFPTVAEFKAAGLARLRSAVRFHGGPAMWAARFGLPAPRPGPRRPK